MVRLARLTRRIRADVVHSNSLHSWYGWAAAAVARRPHVWHAREMVVQSRAALRVERWLARHFAAVVIAVSAAVAAQLDPANVTVITDEADPAEFRPDRAGRFRAAAGIDDRVPLVGSVARLDTWKGFGVLLDAYPAIRAARPEVELVVAGAAVAGKEDYAAWLERRAAGLPGVHWLGPRRDVGDLMADLDVFVQVSTEPEPFGLVIVEALASGVPVVAGAAGGPVEILAEADRTPASRAGGWSSPATPPPWPPPPWPCSRRGSDAARRQARRRSASPAGPASPPSSTGSATGAAAAAETCQLAGRDHVAVRADQGIAGGPPREGRHPAPARPRSAGPQGLVGEHPVDGGGQGRGSPAGTSRAASPSTSGSDPAAVATTGTPRAMASSGGSPKPS